MPVMVELVTWVSTDGIPILRTLVDTLDEVAFVAGEVGDAWGTGGLIDLFGDLGDDTTAVAGHFEDMGVKAGEAAPLFAHFGDDLGRVRAELDRWAEAGLSFDEGMASLTDGLTILPENIKNATAGIGPAFEEAMGGVPDAIAGPVEEGADDAVEAVENMYADIAAEMKEREDSLREAGGNAIDAWLDPQRTGFEISAIESELASQELRDNLASKDPDIKRDAQARRVALVAELISLKNEQATQGDQTAQIANTKALLTSQFMRDGLASKDPEIRELFRAWKLAAETHLGSISDSAYPWGYQVGDELARGMWDSMQLISAAAYEMANTVTKFGPAINSEPEWSGNPLRGITKWGGNIVKTVADGMMAELGTSSGAAAALSASLVPSLTAPGMALATAGASTGGNTYQWILNANGVQRVFSSRDDFMKALDDLGAFGEGRLSG
jgi:hypothetical protein